MKRKKNTLEHWIIGILEHLNIGSLDHGTLEHSISINLHLVTSIALILFKRLRVTLVTSIASMDWMKIWKSGLDIYMYNRPSSLQELLSELTKSSSEECDHILKHMPNLTQYPGNMTLTPEPIFSNSCGLLIDTFYPENISFASLV